MEFVLVAINSLSINAIIYTRFLLINKSKILCTKDSVVISGQLFLIINFKCYSLKVSEHFA